MLETYMIKQLAAFADENTLSGVAERLHVSQPAVSRAMKKLERIIGVPLFDRTKNSITLNKFGKIAAEQAKIAVAAQEELVNSVREAYRRSRTFSFGTIAPAPAWELSPILAQLFHGMAISYELKEEEKPLLAALDEGIHEIIILLRPPESNKYASIPFIRERLSIVLPKNHRLAGRKSLWLKDLAREKFLIHNKIGFWYEMCRRKIPNAVFLDQENLSSLMEIANNSQLPSFITDLSQRSLNQYVPKEKAVIPLLDPEADAQFCCVCLAEKASRLSAVFSAIESIYFN